MAEKFVAEQNELKSNKQAEFRKLENLLQLQVEPPKYSYTKSLDCP